MRHELETERFYLARGYCEAVEAAGGLPVQVMPGADEKTVASIEAAVKRTPHMTELIRAGARPADLLRTALC